MVVRASGAHWVPGLLRNLDWAFNSFRKTEPILLLLTLKPSEFIRRQVKFTPFSFEDVGWLIEQAGEELFLISPDYPHPEGGRDPIKRFEASMDEAEIAESARERVYALNFQQRLGIHVGGMPLRGVGRAALVIDSRAPPARLRTGLPALRHPIVELTAGHLRRRSIPS